MAGTNGDGEPNYPPDLKLVFVTFVHRHGIRSPVKKILESFMPPSVWHGCNMAPDVHAQFLAKERATSVPDSQPGTHKVSHPAKERPLPLYRLLFERCSHGPDKCDSIAMEMLTQSAHNPGGDCLMGQLTDLGKLGMIDLGGKLRKRYVEKLGLLPDFLETLDPISLRSTDYARTLESSQYLLKGMYPSEKRNPDLVLEYHIADQDSEWLFPSTACRRLEDLSAQFTKRMRKVLRSDIEYLGRKFANYLPNPDRRPTTYDLHDLYDQNAILQANNGTLLPKFTMEDFRLVDKVVTGLWFTAFQESEEVKSLGVGPMLREISSLIRKAASQDTPKVKFSELSTHDTGVGPLICGLEIFDGRWPDFASNVTFELFRKQPEGTKKPAAASDHYVRVLYNMKPVGLPYCAAKGDHLEGDPTVCKIESFFKHCERLIPKNYEADCAKPLNS